MISNRIVFLDGANCTGSVRYDRFWYDKNRSSGDILIISMFFADFVILQVVIVRMCSMGILLVSRVWNGLHLKSLFLHLPHGMVKLNYGT